MKTIICGPAHSGKSVFISNLVKLLPSGYYLRINANGDGEGTWSNNPDQDDVKSVRVKGTNTSEDFKRWQQQIENAKNDIVIVDIGGLLQEDKAAFFDACDSFIVVSNNERKADEWIDFGTSHGCTCIGKIHSILSDYPYESVISTKPYVNGKISGLERGNSLKDSLVLKAVADSIIVLSGFKGHLMHDDSNVIDMYNVGIKLGMSRPWKTSSGVEVINVWFLLEKAPLLYNYLRETYRRKDLYKIYGARALWTACLAASCLSEIGVTSLEVNEVMQKDAKIGYIRIPKISIGSNDDVNPLTILKEENDEYILLKVVLPKHFTPEDCKNVLLPPLSTDKKLLLTGEMPAWLSIAIFLTYENEQKYIDAPGIGFIKIEDRKFNKHGEVIKIDRNI